MKKKTKKDCRRPKTTLVKSKKQRMEKKNEQRHIAIDQKTVLNELKKR